jgi:hypothetical protein
LVSLRFQGFFRFCIDRCRRLDIVPKCPFLTCFGGVRILEGLDVLERRFFGVIEILIALEFGPFVLQRPEAEAASANAEETAHGLNSIGTDRFFNSLRNHFANWSSTCDCAAREKTNPKTATKKQSESLQLYILVARWFPFSVNKPASF